MPARPMILFPDARLRRPAAPVEAFGADLGALARDVLDTLVASHAVALTGPPIGEFDAWS